MSTSSQFKQKKNQNQEEKNYRKHQHQVDKRPDRLNGKTL